jgi:hypothetical protein
MAGTVIEALRRFLPAHLRDHGRAMGEAQHRAVWAINHCRTAEMGGHLHGCKKCGEREFHFHSCNHRSCPQCGKSATAEWVERQLEKRVGAPYFMVTFTLPAELRKLFLTPQAKEIHQLFFASSSSSLADTLANPRWLGAETSGFSMVLHTWNQRLQFHPHIHTIVPGAGINAAGKVVTVKSAHYLVDQASLMKIFRARFRDGYAALAKEHATLPAIDRAVWKKDWGVNMKPFGDGANIIKYLGAYVCRTAIGDSRIVSITDTDVSFRWKDRDNNNVIRTDTIPGTEFVKRYFRHVLPRGLRAVRHYGFCHPAAKKKRERIAFHTGRPLLVGAWEEAKIKPAKTVPCPCCAEPMMRLLSVLPAWRRATAFHFPPASISNPGRPPPQIKRSCA